MRNGFKVIDGDGHMQEPLDLWEKYTEDAYRDRIPKISGHMGRVLFGYDPCEAFPEGRPIIYEDSVFADMEDRYGDAYRSWWSLPTRLQHMDQEGVDIQVCFPTNGAVATSSHIKDFKLQAALCRAYNDWAADFCQDSGGRVRFMAQFSLKDMDEAVKEVRRISPNPGTAGFMLMGFGDDGAGQHWSDQGFDVLWQLLQDRDLPAAFHGGGSQQTLFKSYTGNLYAVSHAISFPVDCMLSIGDLVFGDVLERFPNMRCGFYEANAGWVPFWLARMDDHDVGRQGVFLQGHTMPLKPSEYFKRQCFVACDPDEGTLPFVVDYLDGDNIVFNTDYPHPDAPFPDSVDSFLGQPLSESAKGKILWDNSVALYGDRVLSGQAVGQA
ncbi:MAG: amidohydrolase [Chloroflexi bacterium]|nr:amidohydrolase [Chloroflexota bacterium]